MHQTDTRTVMGTCRAIFNFGCMCTTRWLSRVRAQLGVYIALDIDHKKLLNKGPSELIIASVRGCLSPIKGLISSSEICQFFLLNNDIVGLKF